MQLNVGSLFNTVWNINFLWKRLLWKIHQTSQNQWLPYRKNPGGRICMNCFMRAPATSFCVCVLDCLSVGRNQWFSLHHRGAKVWGQTASYQYSMWIKHFIVVPSACALKVPLGSEFQRTAFRKALIQNRHRWQLYYFCTFRCTHICLYLSQLYMPICCNY